MALRSLFSNSYRRLIEYSCILFTTILLLLIRWRVVWLFLILSQTLRVASCRGLVIRFIDLLWRDDLSFLHSYSNCLRYLLWNTLRNAIIVIISLLECVSFLNWIGVLFHIWDILILALNHKCSLSVVISECWIEAFIML